MEEGLQTSVLELSSGTRDFLSGGIAGAAGLIVGSPLDIAKSRSQVFPDGRASAHLKKIITKEGFRSLFKGISYPLASSMLQNAVVFHSYGTALRLPTDSSPTPLHQPPPPSLTHIFTAGCFAGTIQTLIVTPVDLLKINLQLQTAIPSSPQYRGPIKMALDILRQRGLIKGLYRGTVVTALRDVPSHGVYFWAFELTKEWLMNDKTSSNNYKNDTEKEGGGGDNGDGGGTLFGSTEAMAVLGAGGLAGSLSWASIYPIDVVKTRFQSNNSSNSNVINTSKSGALWQCVVDTYRDGGLKTFTRGFWATMCRAFIVNGAIFGAYEGVKNVL